MAENQQSKSKPKPKGPPPFRGSRLTFDIVTHDDGTPCLEVSYRARIPLRDKTLDQAIARGADVAQSIGEGLGGIPVIDRLNVMTYGPLRQGAHKGRLGRVDDPSMKPRPKGEK